MSNQEIKTAFADRIVSGVTRTIPAWVAFLFGVHCISLSSSGIIPFSWVASVWPGASIGGVLTIAMLLCLIHATAYAIIGGVVPHEGADYYFASRVLSPYLAFSASWTLVLFSGLVAGGLAAWVPTTALPSLLRPMAIILNEPRYAELSDMISSRQGVVLFGLLIIVIAAITTVQSNAFLRALLTAGFIFGVTAWIIILWSLYSADGPQAFRTAWDRFMAPTGPYGAFDKRIPLAVNAGMTIAKSAWQMTLAGLIMGFWIFYGYYIPTFFAQEVQRPRKSLLIAAISSLVFAYAIFMLATLALDRLLPPDWVAAEGYLENNKDAVAKIAGGPVVAMPWITFYAAILKPEPILIFAVAFGWLFTLINLVQTYLFYTSRIMFSWALDRALPDWVLGRPGHESFMRAIVLTSILAAVGLGDAAIGGVLAAQLKFAFFAVVTGLVPILALTLLPRLHRDIFSHLPGFLRRSVFAVPVVSYVGFATLGYLIWMIYASFAYPAAGVDNPVGTLISLAIMSGVGLVVFVLMRRYRLQRDQIDILKTYKARVSVDDASIV